MPFRWWYNPDHLDLENHVKLFENPKAVSFIHELPTMLHNIRHLSNNSNPICIRWLREHPDEIDWTTLCKQTYPAAIRMIESNLDRLCEKSRRVLCGNPAAVSIIRQWDPSVWSSMELSSNPSAVFLLEQFPDKINGFGLSMNPSPDAFRLMRRHSKKLYRPVLLQNTNPTVLEYLAPKFKPLKDDFYVSMNPIGIPYLLRDPNLIHVKGLSSNPNGISILLEHQEQIDWPRACTNPALTDLIEGVDSIPPLDYSILAGNPSIFI